jgi:hypothetical protein
MLAPEDHHLQRVAGLGCPGVVCGLAGAHPFLHAQAINGQSQVLTTLDHHGLLAFMGKAFHLWPKAVSVRLALLVTAAALSSCAVGLSVQGQGAVDTKGHFGGEAALAGSAASGDKSWRAFLGMAVGGGDREAEDSAHVLLMPSVGLEFGESSWVRAAFVYAARVRTWGPGTSHGVGGSLSWMFPLARMGGEDSRLALGPVAQAEYVLGPDRGVFSFGLAVSWIMFDTTRRGF